MTAARVNRAQASEAVDDLYQTSNVFVHLIIWNMALGHDSFLIGTFFYSPPIW